MKCLDLKVIEFKPDFYLLEPRQCGWAWPVISGKINVKIYVKYEIPRWTYHDRMHIKVSAEKTYPNYFYIGEDDVYIIEDTNPSDEPITKEKIIETTLGYYDIGAAFKGEDYRNSGWRKWNFAFFTDSGGPTKQIKVSAYWDAEVCEFTDYEVDGLEEPPPRKKAELHITDIRADKYTIEEGESVTVTATISNSGEEAGTCVAELLIDGLLITGKKITVPPGTCVDVSFKIEDLHVGSHEVCIRI